MKHIRNLQRLLLAAVLAVSMLTPFCATTAYAAGGYTCTWTGLGGDGKFSTASNWAGCNSSSPQPTDDDTLVFDNSGLVSSLNVVTNDITNLSVASMQFIGSNNTYAYGLGGTALTVTDNVLDTTHGSFPVSITAPVIMSGAATISTTHTYGTYFADMRGSGAVGVSGGGMAEFTDLSNFTGTLSTNDSVINLMTYTSFTSNGSVAVSGNGSLTLTNESARSANGIFNVPVSLGGSGVSKIGALNLSGNTNGDTVTMTGAFTLTTDVQVTSDGNTTLTISGPVNYNGHAVSSAGANVTTIEVAAGDNRPSEDPVVGKNVTLFNDGTIGEVTVNDGGLLKDNGTTNKVTVAPGGRIEPGHSPGVITIDDGLTIYGEYSVDIQNPGTAAGADYSQLKASSKVDVTDGTLEVTLQPGFIPAVGQRFTIIDNRDGTVISGHFAGMGEGAVFAVAATKFRITYAGNGDNSVVLTVVDPSTPLSTGLTAPDTGFAKPTPQISLLIAGVVLLSLAYWLRRQNSLLK